MPTGKKIFFLLFSFFVADIVFGQSVTGISNLQCEHLDNPLGILRCDILVPRPVRVDDTNWPGGADPKALALGAVARPVRPREVQLLEPLLEIIPGLLSRLRIDAVGPKADEQVSRQLPDAELRRHHRRREMFRIGHGK